MQRKKVITVSNPERVGDRLSAYITFLVTIQSKDGLKLEVRRRYSDFYWLHKRLMEEYKHVLIPPVPEKSITNRFNIEFLNFRCKCLQRFLVCVFNHRELRTSDSLKVFLADSDEEFQNGRNRLQSGQNSSILSPQLLSNLGRTVSSVVPGSYSDTEVDPWYDQMREYLTSFDQYFQNLQKAVNEKQKKKEQEYVITLRLLSEASIQCCQLESLQDRDLALKFESCSKSFSQIATVRAELLVYDQLLEEELSVYNNLLPAARELLNNRKALLRNYFINRDKTTDIMGKIVGATDPNTRVYLEKELAASEERTNVAGSNFRMFSRKSKAELMQNFHSKKELQLYLYNYFIMNLDCENKILKQWQGLLDFIENEEKITEM